MVVFKGLAEDFKQAMKKCRPWAAWIVGGDLCHLLKGIRENEVGSVAVCDTDGDGGMPGLDHGGKEELHDHRWRHVETSFRGLTV